MASHSHTSAPSAPKTTTALGLGLGGIALTLVGFFVDKPATVASSWLIGLTFWTGIALGVLLLVMIHHIFDAGWSTVIRRQFEHVIAVFPWLLLLFVPLLVIAWTNPTLLWKWMDPAFDLAQVGGHGTVGEDPLWVKKAAFLNRDFFTGASIFSFLAWWFLASRFRRNSFSQDKDGDLKWTHSSRKWSAAGIPLTAVTLTVCIILWVKSMEYHWFSTMYGVWFFAGCMRAALSLGVVLMVWLYARGDFKGILNNNHLHSIGQLMLAFTVFWAYVTFSQYFLIWNANIPEETFWYNLREINADGTANQWKWIGIIGILFGHFFVPFLFLLSYRHKVSHRHMRFVSIWILTVIFLDLCYNILPVLKDTHGNALPFFSLNLVWTLSATIGVGGICVWAYLRSFPGAKLIPIRDPRIKECLTHHE